MIRESFRERGREHRPLRPLRERAEGVAYVAMSTMHSAAKRSAVEEARNQEGDRRTRRIGRGGGRISGTMHVPTSRNESRQGEGVASVSHAGFLFTNRGACTRARNAFRVGCFTGATCEFGRRPPEEAVECPLTWRQRAYPVVLRIG